MALSIVATDAATCEIYRRVSAIGWSTGYAILLHFILIITGKSSALNKWRLYVLLYVPALFFLFVFAVPNGINPNPYNLRQTAFGWINVAHNNLWDWLFYAYYIGFTLQGLFLLSRWRQNSLDDGTKKKARIISLSIITALVLGTITDVVISSLFSELPQMAPVIMLIPMLAIYHVLQKDNFGITEGLDKKTSYLILFTSVLIYMILATYQVFSAYAGYGVGSTFNDAPVIRGIIVQIQMFLSIYLVLKENRPGYIVAVLMNISSILSGIAFVIKYDSMTSLPGIVSNVGVLVIITLIKTYKDKNYAYIKRINIQAAILKYNNEHVQLTGLYNRAVLEQTLKRDASLSLPHKRALININLSAMHALSLRYGYNYIQIMLKDIAGALKAYCNDDYLLYNTYEYRFVFYVKAYQDEKELTAFCANVLKTLNSYLYVHGIGIGIGILPIDKSIAHDGNELSKRLMITSEEATKYGNNTNILFYNKEFDLQITRENEISRELREIAEGIKTKRLYLHYQPVFDLVSRKICGFEALARLYSEKYGLISPVEFILLAEKTNMIALLGARIILQAFGFLNKLHENGHELVVTINISVIQMLEEGFVHKLLSMINQMQVNPECIGIELTEPVFATERAEINRVIDELKDAGIKVLIDDFGTGYSSFGRVGELNVDHLKIDKSFIDKLMEENPEKALTGDIISMAHKLGYGVIAEGVEHEKQLSYLHSQGCDKIQGYLISKPLDEDEVLNFLRSYTR